MEKLIYFDNNATTRLDDEVLDSMLPFMIESYGNIASQHTFGLEISKAVEKARNTISELIGSNPKEIIFTAGATESINIALKGLAFQSSTKKTKIITVTTEHMAVLSTCAYLEQIGLDIVYIPVDSNGLVNLEKLKSEIDEYTIAVAIMLVNNETGVIQPIQYIASLCHEHGALLVCDATQAIGKVPVDVNQLNVDLLLFSAHKFHGPKGIGALYIRNGISLSEFIHGGRQEGGLRSGTLNVPAIIGMATALNIAIRDLEKNTIYIGFMRNHLENLLLKLPGTKVNGDPVIRSSNVANVSILNIDSGTLISELKTVAISNGSACTSAVFEPSHVLKAMGLSNTEAFSSIRFSLSKFNTMEEVEEVAQLISEYLRNRILP